jgi:opacity protein-like surface antigen
MRFRLVVLVVLSVLQPVTAVAGSPWVLAADEAVVQFDFRGEFADREFLPDGRNQRFPLNGQFQSQTAGFNFRYGMGQSLELGLSGSYKSLAYKADTVTVVNQVEPGAIQILPSFSLSDQGQGLGDVFLSLRYNAFKSWLLLTPEIEVKVPTGYRGPEGTFANDKPGFIFDEDNNPIEQREGAVPIRDDLSLGDAQIDVRASLLLGTFVKATRTFARADLGYKYRFSGPAPTALWGLKAGQFVGSSFVLFLGVSGEESIGEGDVIGKSFATLLPDTPASSFPVQNFEVIDLRRDKSFTQVSGGGLLRLDDYEIILSGGKIVAGENITESVYLSLGTSYRY